MLPNFQRKASLNENLDSKEPGEIFDLRIFWVMVGSAVFFAFIVIRLFTLQILDYGFYTSLASGIHELYSQLLPERGIIWIHDGDRLFPMAINRDFFMLFANTQNLTDPKVTAEKLAPILGLDAKSKFDLYTQLDSAKKRKDPYEPIVQKLSEEQKQKIADLKIEGLNFIRQPLRYYSEKTLASQVIGFYGAGEDGKLSGKYGIEGYFEKILSGATGFAKGERDAFGAWIPFAQKNTQAAVDGADIVLTIDKTLEFKLCPLLEAHAKEFEAKSATAIVIEPKTGFIKALCVYPSFDPNKYNEVKDIEIYSNDAVSDSYEPGSVFKPLTMAAAINEGVVAPDTKYVDEGFRKFGKNIIRNAADKVYGERTMVGVLENSINTGMIFVVEKLGNKMFKKYVEDFGFGQKTGIELPGESLGNIDSLAKDGDIYAATGSFGQGISATPIQLAVAIGALANGGLLMKPSIIDEIKYPNGTIEKNEPKVVRRVITERASAIISGMMVSVVENGHGKPAGVKGYSVAGKTGTAQIAGAGGYTDETNQTFVGFAPAENPIYAMVVKYEKPKRVYAEYTAAPTFGVFSKFLLQYYKIPPKE